MKTINSTVNSDKITVGIYYIVVIHSNKLEVKK